MDFKAENVRNHLASNLHGVGDKNGAFKDGWDEATKFLLQNPPHEWVCREDFARALRLHVPNSDCKEAEFFCDYRVADMDICPCQFIKEHGLELDANS